MRDLLNHYFQNCQYYSLALISILMFFLLLSFNPFYAYGNELYSITKTILQKDEFGYLHLFGEIKNNSNKSITNIILCSQFLDFENNTLENYCKSPEINTLNPNKLSPFEIIYLDPNSIDEVNTFSLSADYDNGKEKPDLLSVDIINHRLDFTGFYYINGGITNTGTNPAHNVTIVATAYDIDGNIIGLTKAITEPFVIEPKSKAAFGLAVNAKASAFKIKEFSIQAYSENYLSNVSIIKK